MMWVGFSKWVILVVVVIVLVLVLVLIAVLVLRWVHEILIAKQMHSNVHSSTKLDPYRTQTMKQIMYNEVTTQIMSTIIVTSISARTISAGSPRPSN